MVSPLPATLACRQGPPEPSTTLPPAIRRSASAEGGTWADARRGASSNARVAIRLAEHSRALKLAAGRPMILRRFGMAIPLRYAAADRSAPQVPDPKQRTNA